VRGSVVGVGEVWTLEGTDRVGSAKWPGLIASGLSINRLTNCSTASLCVMRAGLLAYRQTDRQRQRKAESGTAGKALGMH